MCIFGNSFSFALILREDVAREFQLYPFEFVFRLDFNMVILMKDYVINELENVLLLSSLLPTV